MSEKIDLTTVQLCMANIDKDGKICPNPKEGDGAAATLGIRGTDKDGNGQFIPLAIRTRPNGLHYIGPAILDEFAQK